MGQVKSGSFAGHKSNYESLVVVHSSYHPRDGLLRDPRSAYSRDFLWEP
jgi:hypothetical protein